LDYTESIIYDSRSLLEIVNKERILHECFYEFKFDRNFVQNGDATTEHFAISEYDYYEWYLII